MPVAPVRLAQRPRPARRLVLVNPAAGRCDAPGLQRAIRAGLGPGVHIVQTRREVDAMTDAVDAIERFAPDELVVAGGDGTVSAVANAAVRSDRPLGVIPVGTANLLARALHIPTDPVQACEVIARGHTKKIDALDLDGRLSFCHVTFGAWAEIGAHITVDAKRRFRRAAYVWKALRELVSEDTETPFTIFVDGRRIEARASFVMIANVGEVGLGELRWIQDIRPDDGAADVLIVRAASFREYLAVAWAAAGSRREQSPHLTHVRARNSVVVSPRRPVAVRGDGEPLPPIGRRLVVRPGILPVFVPG